LFRTLKYYKGNREFEHTYTHNGKLRTRTYLVHRDGTITSKSTGRPLKRHIRETKRKNGNSSFQVQIRLPNKFYNWERVVAAAWFDYFDINDPEQIVKHRNGKKFDMRPSNLYVTSREAELSNLKFLTEEQQKAIKWLREFENISPKKLAKLYKVNKRTIYKVLNGTY